MTIQEFVTAAAVASLLTGGLSLAMELIPGLIELWDGVSTRWKPLVFFVLCLVLTAVVPLLACVGVTLGVEAICPLPIDGVYVTSTLAVTFAAWTTVTATFGVIQDPLGKRIKAKAAVKAMLEDARG